VRVSLASEPRLARVPAFCSSIDEAVLRSCEWVRPDLRARLHGLFGSHKRLLSYTASSFSLHSAPTLGPLEYFHDVCGLQRQTEALSGLWQVAGNASWIVPHRDVCWLAERPQAACITTPGGGCIVPTARRHLPRRMVGRTPGRACWCPAGSSSARPRHVRTVASAQDRRSALHDRHPDA
jgi:hypothetical protein